MSNDFREHAELSDEAAENSSGMAQERPGRSSYYDRARDQVQPDHRAAALQSIQVPSQGFHGTPPRSHRHHGPPLSIQIDQAPTWATPPLESYAALERYTHPYMGAYAYHDPSIQAPTLPSTSSYYNAAGLAPAQPGPGHRRSAMHGGWTPFLPDQRARGRPNDAQSSPQPYLEEQTAPPSNGRPFYGRDTRPEDGGAQPPTMAQGDVYQYSAYFSQPLTGQYRAYASAPRQTFAQDLDDRFLRRRLDNDSLDSYRNTQQGMAPSMLVEGSPTGGPAHGYAEETSSPTEREALQALSSGDILEFSQELLTYEQQLRLLQAETHRRDVNSDATAGGRQASMDRRAQALLALRAGVGHARRAPRARPPPPAQVQHFSTLRASDPSHDTDCPICQDPYDDDEHPAIRPHNVSCTHVFGRGCLQEWCNSGMDNAHKCPSCRQSLAGALAGQGRQLHPTLDVGVPSAFDSQEALSYGYLEHAMRVSERIRETMGPEGIRGLDEIQAGGNVRRQEPHEHGRRQQPEPTRHQRQPHEVLGRMTRAHRHQLQQFDIDATRRIETAQATSIQEADALATQIAEERAALVAQQEDEHRSIRERTGQNDRRDRRRR